MIPWWVALITFFLGESLSLLIIALMNIGKDD